MADEMSLRGDKGRVATEESSAWLTEDRIQTGTKVSDWRISRTSESEPEETDGDADVQQPRHGDSSTGPLFSLKVYLRRSSSTASTITITDSLTASQQSDMGADCAGIILNCLFCRFHDMMLMLPDSWTSLINHCCPNHKQVVSAMEATPSSDDDACVDLDCGLLSSCNDANDCLELAMEVSELCYH